MQVLNGIRPAQVFVSSPAGPGELRGKALSCHGFQFSSAYSLLASYTSWLVLHVSLLYPHGLNERPEHIDKRFNIKYLRSTFLYMWSFHTPTSDYYDRSSVKIPPV